MESKSGNWWIFVRVKKERFAIQCGASISIKKDIFLPSRVWGIRQRRCLTICHIMGLLHVQVKKPRKTSGKAMDVPIGVKGFIIQKFAPKGHHSHSSSKQHSKWSQSTRKDLIRGAGEAISSSPHSAFVWQGGFPISNWHLTAIFQFTGKSRLS